MLYVQNSTRQGACKSFIGGNDTQNDSQQFPKVYLNPVPILPCHSHVTRRFISLVAWRRFYWVSKGGTPELWSRLSTYWPKKWSNKWRCSHHTSTDQTPIPCVLVASSRLKPRGRVWRADAPALSNRAGLARAAKPKNAATPGLGTSACWQSTKHHHSSPLVMPP